MCLAYLAIAAHPDWPLFIAANRDEFHDRPSAPAHPWLDFPDVIAGIDCKAQGTWLGVTRQGKFALLTNYRDPSSVVTDAPSRGDLVSRYLVGDELPRSYACHTHQKASAYNGFNLIVGDLSTYFYVGNRTGQDGPRQLTPGRYIISNHLLNTAWPKAERLRLALNQYPLELLEQSLNPVFALLKDNTRADDPALPQTGLTLERERLLSSPFIVSPDYGTRCSTIIAVHASGRAILSEISYDPCGSPKERHDWPFQIENAPVSCVSPR
ncbi:hypothetical protein CR155_20135 [Pollutimonas nitritireducens]|uniref:NRDE family protein n=1 Tax=Pollutimonas nitritireducens TaxID=2045209 RepID=A0A2N4UAL6_9BURK|nr:NRDE family protein [Pollutimonas nitritireducens]PLC52064.1 hypothetical protein CR155_20135 [Pollutimonas nitritireducens]